jgi:plastocyanin
MSAAAVALAGCLLLSSAAFAGVVTFKGSVHNLESVNPGRRFSGYWRLENGIVPASGPAKDVAAVVLDGSNGLHPPSPRTVTVQLAGLDANPRIVVVGPGSVVEFQNDDKVTHELSTPADPSLVPVERLSPGARRHVKFDKLGAFVIRCAEFPHMMVSVLVVESPLFSAVDDKGNFAIPNAPEGKATLKVWSGGRWVYEGPVEVGPKETRVELSASKAPPTTEGKESDGASSADNKSGE